MKRAWISSALAAGLLLATPLSAKENKWTHFGIRPLAMGNAYVAVADDYNALFYNPARLARLKTWDGELISPQFEIAQNTVKFANDLLSLSSGGESGVKKVLEILQSQTGKSHHAAAKITPHLIFKNFGIGLGISLLDLTMVVHSDIDIELDAGTSIVAPISYARNFLDDRLSLGATVKIRASAGVDKSFNIQTITAFAGSNSADPADSSKTSSEPQLDDFVLGGYAIGGDLGLLFTPIKTMEPTLGTSITDIGGTTYTKFDVQGNSTAAPASELPSVNTGISLKPIQTGKMYLLTALDVHSINKPIHGTHKLNLGLEWGYGSIIKVQAGLKEGYATGGFQFDVGLLNLRLATYAVDHAPVVGTNDDLVERRYTFSLKLLI